MTKEDESIQLSVEKLQSAFVDRIVLSLDTQPTFNKVAVPFQFDYSFFVTIVSNKGKFKIFSAATSDGTETFCIEKVEDILEINKIVEIGSTIASIESEIFTDFRHPYKMVILFQNTEIFLYSGEIYDNFDGILKYNINDEMLLVFYDRQEAKKFENMIKYG
jgi:hypothetical protein